ncbi:MAG: hypothetical protein Q4B01_04590 [Eubacteriales bacterium]|nr:hypothetical protein [Eubacteriales bacterium]
MADFTVYQNSLKQDAQGQAQLFQNMQKYSEAIRSAARSLPMNLSASDIIKRNLYSLAEENDQQVRCGLDMSGKLTQIAQHYVTTENTVSAARTSKPSFIEAARGFIPRNLGLLDTEIHYSLSDSGSSDSSILPYLHSILKALDKGGDISKAGFLDDSISYFEDLHGFWTGDKKGYTGASDICSLTKSSIDVWKSAYEHYRDKYSNIKDGFFGDAVNRRVQFLGLFGSGLGLSGELLKASDGHDQKKRTTIIADYIDCGDEVFDLGSAAYKFFNTDDTLNLSTRQAGPWSPLTVWKAVFNGGKDTASQTFRSIEKYYEDHAWTMQDTAATGIDSSTAGIYSITHTLSFGLDDILYYGIDRATGGNGTKDMSYAQKAAEGYKILGDRIGKELGGWWAHTFR